MLVASETVTQTQALRVVVTVRTEICCITDGLPGQIRATNTVTKPQQSDEAISFFKKKQRLSLWAKSNVKCTP